MLPYVTIPSLSLGPFAIHQFGVLVTIGISLGWRLAVKRAQRLGVDVAELESLLWVILVSGFLGAHVVDNVIYHPAELATRPWRIFMLWQGLSSFGGFTGAVVGALAWKYYGMSHARDRGPFSRLRWPRRRDTSRKLLRFVDIILAVLPVGWAFGRTGCSFAHDHPGAVAKVPNWLTVAYGPGPEFDYGLFRVRLGTTPRYDLGLLELLFTLALAVVFSMTWKREKAEGYYVTWTSLAYAPVRFCFDFLRAPRAQGGDIRYAGLTPAQWACLLLFVFGLWCWRRFGRAAAVGYAHDGSH